MGATLCRLYPFFFYGNVGASLMNMVAITLNRYLAALHPHQQLLMLTSCSSSQLLILTAAHASQLLNCSIPENDPQQLLIPLSCSLLPAVHTRQLLLHSSCLSPAVAFTQQLLIHSRCYPQAMRIPSKCSS
jgi:hypothetical protein